MRARHLVIAGMQRSGTTWLYHMLDQHPRIQMVKPVRPELKFFLRADCVAKGYRAYRECFGEAGDEFDGWLGEKSTSYSEFPRVPRRMSQVVGQERDMRILFILREPVMRAVSNVRFSRQNGNESRSTAKALADNLRGPGRELGAGSAERSVDPLAYLERGLYWRQIEPFMAMFGKDRVGIVLSEDILGNAAVVASIFEWLHVDPSLRLEGLDGRLNTSAASGEPSWDDVPANLRDELAAYYEEPNRQLALATGLDLSPWRNGS